MASSAASLTFQDHRFSERRQSGPLNSARSVTAPIPVVIFNVKFSPNLGDGIIAECLESELRRANSALQPRSLDLAGRIEFSPENGKSRTAILAALEFLPNFARAIIIPIILQVLVRFSLRKYWRDQIDGCKVAIIGGGALFADKDQNFPIKLSGALDLCQNMSIPVAVAHVGMAGHWSRSGIKRLTNSLKSNRIVSASVRDENSAKNWNEYFGSGNLPAPTIAPDPGLLCCDVFGWPASLEHKSMSPMVGLCVTSPMVLRLHGVSQTGSRNVSDWFVQLVDHLLSAGNRVSLFTNGSPEDEEFRRSLSSRLGARDGLELAPVFNKPSELAHFIAGLDFVLSHRLHACIIAYSYQVPAIGLTWDEKVASFFKIVDREGYIIDPNTETLDSIGALVTHGLSADRDSERHAQVLADCRAGIGRLADRLCQIEAPA